MGIHKISFEFVSESADAVYLAEQSFPEKIQCQFYPGDISNFHKLLLSKIFVMRAIRIPPISPFFGRTLALEWLGVLLTVTMKLLESLILPVTIRENKVLVIKDMRKSREMFSENRTLELKKIDK